MAYHWLQIVFVLLFIVPLIFFIVCLQNTLQSVSPENRKMPPGNVWLMFIPLFGIIWQFIVVRKIADSIKEECKKLNISITESRPGYTLGIIYCISYLIFFIPAFKLLGALATVISCVIYWIKINRYKKLIEAYKINYVARC